METRTPLRVVEGIIKEVNDGGEEYSDEDSDDDSDDDEDYATIARTMTRTTTITSHSDDYDSKRRVGFVFGRRGRIIHG